MKTLIGIDPGVKTGYAVNSNKALVIVSSAQAVDVECYILARAKKEEIQLIIEDARKRTWFGTKGHEVKQGAGSIKRDCQRWEEFCLYHKIRYELVPPKANRTKLKAATFKALTGYLAQTNEHGRDAAMLVYGK